MDKPHDFMTYPELHDMSKQVVKYLNAWMQSDDYFTPEEASELTSPIFDDLSINTRLKQEAIDTINNLITGKHQHDTKALREYHLTHFNIVMNKLSFLCMTKFPGKHSPFPEGLECWIDGAMDELNVGKKFFKELVYTMHKEYPDIEIINEWYESLQKRELNRVLKIQEKKKEEDQLFYKNRLCEWTEEVQRVSSKLEAGHISFLQKIRGIQEEAGIDTAGKLSEKEENNEPYDADYLQFMDIIKKSKARVVNRYLSDDDFQSVLKENLITGSAERRKLKHEQEKKELEFIVQDIFQAFPSESM